MRSSRTDSRRTGVLKLPAPSYGITDPEAIRGRGVNFFSRIKTIFVRRFTRSGTKRVAIFFMPTR